MKGLEIQMALDAKTEQYNKCPNDAAKKKIKENIDDLNKKIDTITNEINTLASTIGFDSVIKPDYVDYQKRRWLEGIINQY